MSENIIGTLSDHGQLIGVLTGPGQLTGQLTGSGQLTGQLTIPKTVDARPYDGAYNVIPVFEEITLETSGKLMRRDVSVESIPVHSTTNLSGGYTVTIGGEM